MKRRLIQIIKQICDSFRCSLPTILHKSCRSPFRYSFYLLYMLVHPVSRFLFILITKHLPGLNCISHFCEQCSMVDKFRITCRHYLTWYHLRTGVRWSSYYQYHLPIKGTSTDLKQFLVVHQKTHRLDKKRHHQLQQIVIRTRVLLDSN